MQAGQWRVYELTGSPVQGASSISEMRPGNGVGNEHALRLLLLLEINLLHREISDSHVDRE